MGSDSPGCGTFWQSGCLGGRFAFEYLTQFLIRLLL